MNQARYDAIDSHDAVMTWVVLRDRAQYNGKTRRARRMVVAILADRKRTVCGRRGSKASTEAEFMQSVKSSCCQPKPGNIEYLGSRPH